MSGDPEAGRAWAAVNSRLSVWGSMALMGTVAGPTDNGQIVSRGVSH